MKFEDFKALAEAIGAVGGLLNGVLLGMGTWLLPTITRSQTFQAYIRYSVLIGGVLGFFFTLTGAAGQGKTSCLRRRRVFICGALASVLIAVFVIVLTEGGISRYIPALAPLRDAFYTDPVLANLTLALFAGLAMYLFIGAIVLSLAKVWSATLPTTTPPLP